MKQVILLVFALFMTTGAVIAQDKMQVEDANYVILLNEKVFQYKKTGVELLKSDLKLNNGTVVKTDGSYITKDGDKMMLKDGQCLGMSGKLYKDQATLSKKLKKEMK
ncbi:DUF6799 domain-containing protein [Mesoflavibacter zeaxanthinifaciens]|uniref:DUF6799 domain-containing protein n=1 Tax=Mesoflavibacter zeaxanthinifaciens TaxID=393060 RepID=UPI003A92EC1A